MVLFGESFKQEGPGACDCGLEIADCGLKEAGLDGVRAKRSQFGGRIVRNEPNLACRSPAPEEIVQNEAKVGVTGAYGQRQLSCVTWPGRRVSAQNKPNLAHQRKMSGGNAQPPIRPGAGCTKSRSVQNEPNLARSGAGAGG
jgi:hypothetical protein